MGALKSSHCSKGHPMVSGNLYYRRSGKQAGKRICKTCSDSRAAEFRKKLRKLSLESVVCE